MTVHCPSDEIIMHDGVTAVYKSNVDLFFCVLGAQNENEVCVLLVLHNYLPCTCIPPVDAGWCAKCSLRFCQFPFEVSQHLILHNGCHVINPRPLGVT